MQHWYIEYFLFRIYTALVYGWIYTALVYGWKYMIINDIRRNTCCCTIITYYTTTNLYRNGKTTPA